ncbi:MAG: hypothetical protein JO285_09465 [Kutzneria sp.]|nr:hypothetical protein [Kutzneria sp.]
MTGIENALADVGQLRAAFVGEQGSALAYGSHATSTTAAGSDLDLLVRRATPAP